MKLHQHLFWRKFLPSWGAIGILLPMVIMFCMGKTFEMHMVIRTCAICTILSATIGWKCCSTHHWIPLSISMTMAFCVVIAIRTVIACENDISWAIMLLMYCFPIFVLPCVLLIFVVNYLMLRKQLSL